MKKFLSVFLAAILLLALVSCGESEDGAPMGMKRASNPDIVDYTLYVPEDWVVTSSTGMTMAQVSYNDPTNIIVTHHSHTSLNEYQDVKFMLIAYLYGEDEVKLPGEGEEKTYREYEDALLLKAESYLGRLYASFDTVKNDAGETVSSFAMVDKPSFTTLNKGEVAIPAITFTYTATLDGAAIWQKMILAYEDAYYFNITITTAPALVETHTTTFGTIIENFSFDN